jgi:hypothetical protein
MALKERAGDVVEAAAVPTVALLLMIGGCTTSEPPPNCPAGAGSPMRVYELYFGRAITGRDDVSEVEWRAFRDQSITPNLPEGYTVLDGSGAWLNPQTHTTITEPTKILIAATPDTPASLAAIQRIRTDYEAAFHQQSVGMTSHQACGSFSP